MSEVYERTSDFIESLREQYTDAAIIICSHGSPLINLISYVDNVPVDCSHEAVPKNTGTTDEDAYILREI